MLIYFGLFCMLILFFIKFMIWDRYDIIANPYNPRVGATSVNVIRGEIRDRKGKILATNRIEGEKIVREYPFGPDFVHVLGYGNKMRTGIEAQQHFILTSSREPWYIKLQHLIFQEPIQGDHIYLTLDADIQKKANQLLKGKKGAIVIMEPLTGKILSMVSYPNFNPHDLEDNWEILSQDSKNSPLLNRATQGLYPPGSIFKLITAAGAIEQGWAESFQYDCQGEAIFNHVRLQCYGGKAHGKVDIQKALQLSCNTAFAEMGILMGGDALKIMAEKMLFNYPINSKVAYNSSQFTINKDSLAEDISKTAIGQGKTLVTPFQMALMVSAIANQGVLMKPYMVDRVENSFGKIKDKTIPSTSFTMISPELATKLGEMMVEVVEVGTGTNAQIRGTTVAGKTGTAENENDQPHAWFVGFAPAKNPQVSIVVVIENAGIGGQVAAPIARELLKDIIER